MCVKIIQYCEIIVLLIVFTTVISNSNSETTSDVQATNEACGAGNSKGVIKNIYYENDEIIKVCYNDNNGEAIYADHIIKGSKIANSESKNKRPGFKVAGLNPKVRANDVYTQSQQLKTFESLLGSKSLAKKYIYSNSFLAKGHLAANADYCSVTSASRTFFYLNTVPEWQQINCGNWYNLERSIRSLAAELEKDIRVITGGWKVLQLADNNANMKDIYLSGNLLPVPKFIWKIAYSPTTKTGIAFFTVNNPFLSQITSEEMLCTNICSTYNWGKSEKSDWTTVTKGLIYCCDINDLKIRVETIPDLDVSSILQGPVKVNLQ